MAERLRPVGAQFLDARRRRPRLCAIGLGQRCDECAQIDGILRTVRCQSEQLHGHEMSRLSDGDGQARCDFKTVGIPADLRLDARGREEQVNDDPFVRFARRGEAHSGQTVQCVVSQRQAESESTREQVRDQCLGAGVIDDRGGNIDVPREARFAAHRNG
jgi:hypothetical protein